MDQHQVQRYLEERLKLKQLEATAQSSIDFIVTLDQARQLPLAPVYGLVRPGVAVEVAKEVQEVLLASEAIVRKALNK